MPSQRDIVDPRGRRYPRRSASSRSGAVCDGERSIYLVPTAISHRSKRVRASADVKRGALYS
jgi:hypothetical protein